MDFFLQAMHCKKRYFTSYAAIKQRIPVTLTILNIVLLFLLNTKQNNKTIHCKRYVYVKSKKATDELPPLLVYTYTYFPTKAFKVQKKGIENVISWE